MISTPDSIEGIIIVLVRWVKLGVELFGAGFVTLGLCPAILHLSIRACPMNKNSITFGALGIESRPTFAARIALFFHAATKGAR